MRSFGSDNHSGVHPFVLKAIAESNSDHDFAYGDDKYTQKLSKTIKKTFGEEAEIFPVFNGTGANVCAIRACTQSYHAVIAAETAHIAVDECGAVENLCHCAVKTIHTIDGKLTPEMISPFFHTFGFEHHSQPKMVYISQCTELGTLYSLEEIRAIANLLHQHNMYLHMDGARIANAAATLDCSLRDLTHDAGVDILSFGGTKNGLMMGESVITFKPELADYMKYIRKQASQLYSKMRFCSAQFLAYFEQDLWKSNAQHANQMAHILRRKIEELGIHTFTQKTEANILLLKLHPKVIEILLKNHFFYVWDEHTHEVRFVTSWDSSEMDITDLVQDIEMAHKSCGISM